MVERYLRPMLEAGSSRVLNCNYATKAFLALPADDKKPRRFLFQNAKLNDLIYIKEAHMAKRTPRERVVRTKAYLPYNNEDIYEGGRSVFIGDSHFAAALNDYLGVNAKRDSSLDYDLRILKIIDGLPSLDGFLLKDALMEQGCRADDIYFDITGEEWDRIRSFIRGKLEPIVKLAMFGNSVFSDMTDYLVQKIWEAADLEALAPLVAALHLPKEHALEIFKSWKGINFYAYQYAALKPSLVLWATWLRDYSRQRDAVPSVIQAHIDAQREAVKTSVRSLWSEVDRISRDYDDSYGKLLNGEEGATDFIRFVQNSRTIYWKMGDHLSRLSHGFNCWNKMTEYVSGRILKSEQLEHLLEIETAILAEFPPANASAGPNIAKSLETAPDEMH